MQAGPGDPPVYLTWLLRPAQGGCTVRLEIDEVDHFRLTAGRRRRLAARPGCAAIPHPSGLTAVAYERPAIHRESLTATGRAVSLLVAAGLTNGAVARRLYILPHTVNNHLRHVFAKLGAPDQVAVAAVVHHSIK